MNQFWKFSKDATTEGTAEKSYLGGKGVGLVEMARAGLPVPPGIIIPTTVCPQVMAGGSAVLKAVAAEALFLLATVIPPVAALVSVRSGAAVSMPGMMDTILNVGIHDGNLEQFQKSMGAKAALDCYRRLVQMYGVTVRGMDVEKFHIATQSVMTTKYGEKLLPKTESDMNVMRLEKLLAKNLKLYEMVVGEEFPQTIEDQLSGAIGAVFGSWDSERAQAYRKENKIPDTMYTACIIQQMVFGNLNKNSCSGVLFSRNPSTGANEMYGDFLVGGQGEEVVSGSVNTQKISEFSKWNKDAAAELFGIVKELELGAYQDMVDTEFTVENGKVWMLQVRTGKRSAAAAFKISYDMANEKTITRQQALKRVTATQYAILSRPQIDPTFKIAPLITGVAASKGIATGRIWFSSDKAQLNQGGILVTKETTPDDFAGMAASAGILTKLGGSTSHAAVVARAMDRACVVGCNGGMEHFGTWVIGGKSFVEGSILTIDGNTGNVYDGAVPMVGGTIPDHVNEMMLWSIDSFGVTVKYDVTKDTIPTQGEVYLSMINAKTSEAVAAVIHGLSDKCHGILSFSDDPKFDDNKFLSALCLKSQAMTATIDQIAGLAVASKNAVAANFTVVGIDIDVDLGQFKIHKKLETIGQLMAHDGYYELSDNLYGLLNAQGVNMVELADLLKQAGKSLTPITKPISKSELAFQVFGQ